MVNNIWNMTVRCILSQIVLFSLAYVMIAERNSCLFENYKQIYICRTCCSGKYCICRALLNRQMTGILSYAGTIIATSLFIVIVMDPVVDFVLPLANRVLF